MAECEDQEEVVDRTISSGSEGLEYTCQPCGGDDKRIEAAGFCVDCSEFLCHECFKYHPKPRMFKHHQLVDIEEVKRGEFSGWRDRCSKKCNEHRGKTIKYFCADHDCLACAVCINLEHRACTNVQYIPKVSESVADGEEFSTLFQGLEAIVQRSKQKLEVYKKKVGNTQEAYSKALEDMEQVIKDSTEVLEKLQNEIEAEAKQMKSEQNKKLGEMVTLCDDIQSKTVAMLSNLTRLKKSGQNCNLFVTLKTKKNKVAYLEEQLDQISDKNDISDFLFRPNNCLKEFLMHKHNLGKVLQQKTATQISEINVKTQTDKKICSIDASVILSHNKMAVADNSNNKVKLVDLKQSKVIHEVDIPGTIWQVSTTSAADKIAVTLHSAHSIMILKIKNDTLSKDLEIKTSGSCYGLSSIDNKFIVSLIAPERLEIIDRQGKVLQTIQTDADGKNMFKSIWSVAVNNETEKIYVPDYENQTITCLSLSGQVENVYKESSMRGARGAAIDKSGDVLVCSGLENIIHQFTPDLKASFFLSTTDDFVSLRSMCYCEDTHYLYVGQNHSTIRVFELP